MPCANNGIVRRVPDFVDDVRFIIFYEIDVDRMMADLSIDIFLPTFLRNVDMSGTAENAKMRQRWLDSKPYLMRSNVPMKAGVRKPILEIDGSEDCLRP